MTTPAPLARDPDTAVCENCGAPLLGPHCYRCGQPVDGLVRHFSSIIGDFLDTVLNIDARVFRTLWPLFAKPGYLSCEYFAGRRVRYVSPVRLFVFLSIVTFFVARLTLNVSGNPIQLDGGDAIASATTVAQVVKLRDEAIAEIAKGRSKAPGVPGLDAGLSATQDGIRGQADRRIAEITSAAARGAPPPRPKPNIPFGDNKGPWDAKTNPLIIHWLPAFANDWINLQIGHAENNIVRMQDDPSLFKDAVLGAIPSTLFVLLPVFALLLKLLYIFKRRLYMEHLIVALHSHAFLCMTLLVVFLIIAMQQEVPAGGWNVLLGWMIGLLFAWMPVYLWLMQKRVYGQGWLVTSMKYSLLGFCYIMLLSFGAALTVLGTLVWT
ncbi:MAG: DUF3667 domain-containing protein [Luteimonas sp.]